MGRYSQKRLLRRDQPGDKQRVESPRHVQRSLGTNSVAGVVKLSKSQGS